MKTKSKPVESLEVATLRMRLGSLERWYEEAMAKFRAAGIEPPRRGPEIPAPVRRKPRA